MENFIFTRAGREWNEDRGFVCKTFGFVLDGATGLIDEHFTSSSSDAEWYSDSWCKYLKVALCDTTKSLLTILEEGFDKVTGEYKKILGAKKVTDYPSATISIVRDIGDEIEMYTLGDSPILIQDVFGETCIFEDTRNIVNDFVIHGIAKNVALKENINICEIKDKYPNIIMEGRLKRNKFGGYYVLSNNKSALKFGFYQTMPKSQIKKIILMTDGFSQIIDVFKFMSEEELVKKLKSALDAEKFYNKLVYFQQKDKFGNKFTRFKTTDDATVVCMTFD